jgi:hypothetical protein
MALAAQLPMCEATAPKHLRKEGVQGLWRHSERLEVAGTVIKAEEAEVRAYGER